MFPYGTICAVFMKLFKCFNLFCFQYYISHNEINVHILKHTNNKIRHYIILITYNVGWFMN